LARLFKSRPYIENLFLFVTGIRQGQNIDYTKLGRSALPLPPSEDQSAIVRFHDYFDRRIRKYIRARQKLIGLLNEQKQAIIHKAVTRGLDPNVKLKPSGVPWLGDVPERWGTMSSKRLFTVREETTLPGDEQLSATQAYGVISQNEFERRVGRRVVHVTQHLEKRRHVERDDFVISMRSFQGGLERAWAEGCIRSSYVVLRPTARVHVGYFAHLFKSYGYIRALQATCNFIRDGQDLNFNHFCIVDLPVVPMQKQKDIASFLDQTTGDIGKATLRAQREIDLLREYRTRLVADVVTGKLDVREAAAYLPEEAEEVEEPELPTDEEPEEDVEDAGGEGTEVAD
jgi:type I restriction enzyme S subunit